MGQRHNDPMGAFVYIVKCRDGKYYTGTTRDSLERRVAEHNDGTFGGFTSHRRPVTLVYSEYFRQITDAIEAERQIKGWSRAKKEALIKGGLDKLPELSRNRQTKLHPSTGSG
jgi:predicted GIY-YIG superfamily endonuclease